MPRMTAPNGEDHLEVASRGEVANLRAQGWTESASLTKDGKAADELVEARRRRDPRVVPNKKVGAPPVLRPDPNPSPEGGEGPKAS